MSFKDRPALILPKLRTALDRDWIPLFSTVTRFAETQGKPDFDDASENFQSVKLRDSLNQCTPALAHQVGRIHTMQATTALRGTELIIALMSDLETLLD